MIRKVLLILVVLALGVFIYINSATEVTANLDSNMYELPFAKGESYKVVQGYGGRFSHHNKAALDFSMPEGTPVHAARGGIIYSYKDDSNEGGPFSKYAKKANYIIIKHDDGTYGCYWHLKKNGVVVRKGNIKPGQLIGYSGSTGFVLRPHLHFAVKRILNYEKDSFVKTKFRTGKGNLILQRGETYQKP